MSPTPGRLRPRSTQISSRSHSFADRRMMPSKLFVLLGVLVSSCSALRVDPSLLRMGPAPAIAKPKTITRQKTGGGGPGGGGGTPTIQVAKPKLKRVVEDVPMWKVNLLGDAEYEEDPVRLSPPDSSGSPPRARPLQFCVPSISLR